LRVRWNALGTPAALSIPGQVLATGLAADPETAARQYLQRNAGLFGLTAAAVDSLERVSVAPIGSGAAVLLRQRYGNLPAGYDGQVALAIRGGSVVRVTSSLARDPAAPGPATLTVGDAVRAALADAGLTLAQLASSDVRQVAVPTPAEGPRAAYEVTLVGADQATPAAFASYVDGQTGAVLVRNDLVHYDSDNPRGAVAPAAPPPSGADERVVWCLNAAPGCSRAGRDPVSGQAWDVDIATGSPTFTSQGNSVNDVLNWGAGTTPVHATASPERNYTYPLTDQWHVARCHPD